LLLIHVVQNGIHKESFNHLWEYPFSCNMAVGIWVICTLLTASTYGFHMHGMYNATFPAHRIPETIIIVGVSGLSSAALQNALKQDKAPQIQQLMDTGSWTMDARAQAPTLSLPNWASVLTATSPAMHGVFEDNWTV
jgi:predicted AlkP superfamily pyrophosphatase or phosphodiesterase